MLRDRKDWEACDMCQIPLDPQKYGPPDGYPKYHSPQCARDRGGYWQGYSKEYLAERKKRRNNEQN